MLVAELVGILGWAGISPQTLLAASSNPNVRAIFIALFLGSVGAALGGFRRRDGWVQFHKSGLQMSDTQDEPAR